MTMDFPRPRRRPRLLLAGLFDAAAQQGPLLGRFGLGRLQSFLGLLLLLLEGHVVLVQLLGLLLGRLQRLLLSSFAAGHSVLRDSGTDATFRVALHLLSLLPSLEDYASQKLPLKFSAFLL